MYTLAKPRHNWKVGLTILLFTIVIVQWSSSDPNIQPNSKFGSPTVQERIGDDSNLRIFPRLQVSKRDNDTVSAARKVVASAIEQMRVSNKAQVQNPSRNIYTLKPGTSTKRRRDVAAPMVVNSTIAAAAALVAEVDAQAQAANGTLVTSYPEVDAIRNRGNSRKKKRETATWWMEGMDHLGTQPFGGNASYVVWRDVTKPPYNAAGDGTTDDTAAINAAISDGNRCGEGCESSSTTGALVYFPGGTYLVSGSIISYYDTQLVGNPNDIPTIKASASFVGLGVISTDVYVPNGGTGPDGLAKEWYINTSNFYRQIRNFNIDISATDQGAYVAAIHYQVAQATSLYNVAFISTVSSTTTQQGMYAENGSGGFMSNLIFTGGAFGIWGGNQQFTASGLVFQNVGTGIQTIWDWGWTWKNIQFEGCTIGINLLNQADQATGAASVVFQDSIFQDTTTGILIGQPTSDWAEDTSVLLDNVAFSGVTDAVKDLNGNVYLAGSVGSVDGWALGKTYVDSDTATFTYGTSFAIPRNSLLTGSGNPMISGYNLLPKTPFLDQPKPQYDTASASGFVQMKNLGDGVTIDTVAFQAAITKYAGSSIIFIDAGSYILTETITVPAGAQIVGECWAQLVASGANFEDQANPSPLLRIGNPGDVGTVELQDLLFTSVGPTAGLIAVEWNLDASSQGAAAMWDCHVRLGGATGTDMQVAECPSSATSANTNCIAGSLMLHLTPSASAYLENVWLWTADHDIDDPNDAQISVYVGRGMLVESTNPVWLYATAAEHATLYQYTFYEAENIISGMIQTESPYYQPTPSPPTPFEVSIGLFSGDDQTLFDCTTGTAGCDASWALRIIESSWIQISGAGLYTWFDDYVQEPCVDSQDCQISQVSIENSNGNVWIFNLITIGAANMVMEVSEGASLEIGAANNTNTPAHPYWSLITVYQPSIVPNDGGNGTDVYVPTDIWSSTNPTIGCIPPCTLILPPYSLGFTTTIQWPNLTTTLLSSSAGYTYTITTTISVPAFTTDVIEWWAITVYVTDTTAVTLTAEQSVMPPPFTIILPPGEETFPPTEIPTINYSGTSSAAASSSTSLIAVPIFYTTSHPVTIQQQPTYSMSTPPPTPAPTLTYQSGKPSSTCRSGCGTTACPIFGCDHHCGFFGCGGGCGIFGCGGGCGLLGCPGDCPLGDCGGINCLDGSCGDTGCPNGDCDETSTSCESTVTETNCIEWCSITSLDGQQSTDCTSSSCFPTSGCEVTATTTTVTTSTDSAYSCPAVPTGFVESVDVDPFDGCQPCNFHYIPWETDEDTYGWDQDPEIDPNSPDIWPDIDANKRRRAVHQGVKYDAMPTPPPILGKRAGSGEQVPSVGLCSVPAASVVTTPTWTVGGTWLASERAGSLVGTQTDMPRWYATTVEAPCNAKMTIVPEAALAGTVGGVVRPTIDHAWEAGWLDDFMSVMFGSTTAAGIYDCTQMDQIFFTGGCTTPENRMLPIWNALPSEENWDFVGMLKVVNQIKGRISKNQFPAEVVNALNKGNMVVATPWERTGAPNNWQRWGKREKFNIKLERLWEMILGCTVVNDPDVFALMDKANNRIWNEFRAIDLFVSDNSASFGYTTDFGTQFQNFMNAKTNTLLQNARTSMDNLVTSMNTDTGILDNPIITDPIQRNILDSFIQKFNYLKTTYNVEIGSGTAHVCAQPAFQWSWVADDLEGSTPGCCGGCCIIMKRDGNLVKRQDASSCLLETSAPTNPPSASGGSGSGGGGSGSSTTSSAGGGTTIIPSSPEPTARLIIAWDSAPYELDGYSNWWFYDPPVDESYDFCTDSIGSMPADPNIAVADVPFPAGTFDLPFDVLGEAGCVYQGTASAPGIFTCPDLLDWIQCIDNSQDGSDFPCDISEEGQDDIFPKITCQWD